MKLVDEIYFGLFSDVQKESGRWEFLRERRQTLLQESCALNRMNAYLFKCFLFLLLSMLIADTNFTIACDIGDFRDGSYWGEYKICCTLMFRSRIYFYFFK